MMPRDRINFTAKAARASRRRAARRGFTLIEALAALLLIALVLPVAMEGVTIANRAASLARRRAEAGALAESKLAELVATQEWQNGGGGDFGPDWPDYKWNIDVVRWTQPNVQELDVQVQWVGRGNQPEFVTVSTLVYVPGIDDGTTDDTTGATTP